MKPLVFAMGTAITFALTACGGSITASPSPVCPVPPGPRHSLAQWRSELTSHSERITVLSRDDSRISLEVSSRPASTVVLSRVGHTGRWVVSPGGCN